jgi:CheY-like chemotaxis protein
MAQFPDTPKLLIANGPQEQSMIPWCLLECDLTFVHTFAEAISKVGATVFNMVLIDLDFADSRMFDLLRHVRSLAAYKDVPVVCVQGAEPRSSPGLPESIDAAIRAMGGRAFLDLRAKGDALEQACQYLRQILAFEAGAPISPIPPAAC